MAAEAASTMAGEARKASRVSQGRDAKVRSDALRAVADSLEKHPP